MRGEPKLHGSSMDVNLVSATGYMLNISVKHFLWEKWKYKRLGCSYFMLVIFYLLQTAFIVCKEKSYTEYSWMWVLCKYVDLYFSIISEFVNIKDSSYNLFVTDYVRVDNGKEHFFERF